MHRQLNTVNRLHIHDGILGTEFRSIGDAKRLFSICLDGERRVRFFRWIGKFCPCDAS